MIASCNNNKEAKTSETTEETSSEIKRTEPAGDNSLPAPGSPAVSYSIDGKEYTSRGSVLVQKGKEKVSAGNELLAIITANDNKKSFVLNFVFTPKTGVYPVVGHSFTNDKQVFGGILGGRPKMTNYKVNLTKCDDLGSNNAGGHKWLISGNMEGELTIPAMSIMKMDTSHPDEVKVSNISFTNLTFDDNWEQMLEEGMKKLKKNK